MWFRKPPPTQLGQCFTCMKVINLAYLESDMEDIMMIKTNFFYFHYEVNLKIHSCKIFLLNNSRIFSGKSIFFENYEVYESDNMADAKKKFVMVILTTTLYHLIKSTIVIIFYTIKYG